MKKHLFVLIALIVATACSNPPSQAEKDFKQMRQDVFHQHDELMGKMSTLSTYISKLKPKIDSTQRGLTYKKASQRLKNAHNLMMTWMHSFHDNFPDINNDKKEFTDKEYRERTKKLKGTKKVLDKVEHDMNQSISYAKLVLKRGNKSSQN